MSGQDRRWWWVSEWDLLRVRDLLVTTEVRGGQGVEVPANRLGRSEALGECEHEFSANHLGRLMQRGSFGLSRKTKTIREFTELAPMN